jgi:5'-nucleotidase
MRILITNDDGIHAAGIGALARDLASRGLDVVVVAPATEASGSSAGLGALQPGGTIVSERVIVEAAPDVPAHAVSGPPAMCVLAGLTRAFGPVPDVVVSGLNDGYNLGRAVIHSGTVGAALTARMLNVPALAISGPPRVLPHHEPEETDRRAGELVAHLLASLVDWPEAALNVNLPPGAWTQVRPARLSSHGAIRLSVDAEHSVRVELETATDDPDPGDAAEWPSDLGLVSHGVATITPLSPVGVAATGGQAEDLASTLTFAAS